MLVRVEQLSKVYRAGGRDLAVLDRLDLGIEAGERVAIVGESGAGKSTLLHLLAGLDRPTAGRIYYKDQDLTALTEAEVADFRNREIGYVWQQHHLIREFTAVENAEMPMRIQGENGRSQAIALLEEVGLAGRADHRPGELSGGEQQRVAIARALVARPSLLLADEPTGDLDEKTGAAMFELLTKLTRKRGLTSILVTHNLQFARQCDRVLRLEAGVLKT